MPDALQLQAIDAKTDDEFISVEDFHLSRDFDRDGLAEHFELAAGIDPLVSDGRGIWTSRYEDGYLIIRFVESSAQVDFKLYATTSTDLQSWTQQEVVETLIEENGSYRVREWKIHVQAETQFLRLELSRK